MLLSHYYASIEKPKYVLTPDSWPRRGGAWDHHKCATCPASLVRPWKLLFGIPSSFWFVLRGQPSQTCEALEAAVRHAAHSTAQRAQPCARAVGWPQPCEASEAAAPSRCTSVVCHSSFYNILHAGPTVCQPCKASEAAVWHAAPATVAGSSQLIHVTTLTSELLFGTPRPQQAGSRRLIHLLHLSNLTFATFGSAGPQPAQPFVKPFERPIDWQPPAHQPFMAFLAAVLQGRTCALEAAVRHAAAATVGRQCPAHPTFMACKPDVRHFWFYRGQLAQPCKSFKDTLWHAAQATGWHCIETKSCGSFGHPSNRLSQIHCTLHSSVQIGLRLKRGVGGTRLSVLLFRRCLGSSPFEARLQLCKSLQHCRSGCSPCRRLPRILHSGGGFTFLGM